MTTKPQVRAKAWGAQTERDAAAVLRSVWPTAERAGGGKASQGLSSTDIVGVPFHVQVKARATSMLYRIWKAADAARKAAPGEKRHRTIVVTRDKGGRLMVFMPLTDWLADYERECG